jgi:hypothetical protein
LKTENPGKLAHNENNGYVINGKIDGNNVTIISILGEYHANEKLKIN